MAFDQAENLLIAVLFLSVLVPVGLLYLWVRAKDECEMLGLLTVVFLASSLVSFVWTSKLIDDLYANHHTSNSVGIQNTQQQNQCSLLLADIRNGTGEQIHPNFLIAECFDRLVTDISKITNEIAIKDSSDIVPNMIRNRYYENIRSYLPVLFGALGATLMFEMAKCYRTRRHSQKNRRAINRDS
jgi:hypothetical protein